MACDFDRDAHGSEQRLGVWKREGGREKETRPIWVSAELPSSFDLKEEREAEKEADLQIINGLKLSEKKKKPLIKFGENFSFIYL